MNEMERIKLSVVMPIYNAESYLDESLGSLINQTETNFEVICVDDGSTDGSASILKKYAENDRRFRIIFQKNQSAGAARNAGVKVAKGEYILFLDSDDVFESELIKKAYEAAKRRDVEILIFGADSFSFYDRNDVKASPYLLMTGEMDEESKAQGILSDADRTNKIFRITNTTVWNKLFKRDFIERNKLTFQSIYVVNAMQFVMLALMEAKSIGYLDEVLVHYRTNNPNSTVGQYDKNPVGIYEALYAVHEEMIKRNLMELYFEVFNEYAQNRIANSFGTMRSYEGKKELFKVLREGGLNKLGINSRNIVEPIVRSMLDIDFETYLVTAVDFWEETGILSKRRYIIPDINNLSDRFGSRVVVYGAGLVGKTVFTQVLNSNQLKLIAWVDKRSEQLGYLVKNPDEMQNEDYDVVIIAVKHQAEAERIKQYLIEIGVSSQKIIWEKPVMI